MPKKIICPILVFLSFFVWFILNPTTASAQVTCTCNNWDYNYKSCKNNNPYNNQCSYPSCGSNQNCGSCGSGTFPTNDGSCRPYGLPAPPPPPPPPPACTCGAWEDGSCNIDGCVNQMLQIRSCSPEGCAGELQCVANANCAETCSVTLSPSISTNVLAGSSFPLTETVSSNAPVIWTAASSANTSAVTVSGASGAYPTYTATVNGIAVGSSVVTVNVTTNGTNLCSTTLTVNTVNPNQWWQVKDSDVTSNADLTSVVPVGQVFDLPGAGTFPGVPSYVSSTTLSTPAIVSSTGWIAQNTPVNPKTYNYQSLYSQIPTSITSTFNTVTAGDAGPQLTSSSATHDSNNYYWFMYNGDLNGNVALNINSDVNLNGRKAILLIKDADLNISADINVNGGFFMVAVGKNSLSGAYGNINVGPPIGGAPPQAAANIEGIYEADGSFNDGVGVTQLWLRGSVIAYGGFNLQRNMGAANPTTPAELFEFAPDQVLMFPTSLETRELNWIEVAP